MKGKDLYKLIYDKISQEEKDYKSYFNFHRGYRTVTYYRNNYNRNEKITLCEMPSNPVCFILQWLYDKWNEKINLDNFKFCLDMAWVTGGRKSLFMRRYYGLYKALKEINKNER